VLAITNFIKYYTGYIAEDVTCTHDITVADVEVFTSLESQHIGGRKVVRIAKLFPSWMTSK